MILPLHKKPRTTRLSTRPLISDSIASLTRRLVVVSSVCSLVLGSTIFEADSAELQWSRPSASSQVAQRRRAERAASHPRKRAFHDPAVVAAVWEEDDSFVAQTQVTEDRSVVVRRSTVPRMSSRDRLAQLPGDPFEQSDDPALELQIEDPPIEEVEKAIEQEIDRRETEQELSDLELFDDSPAESELAEESELGELFEEETMDDQRETTESDPFDEPLVESITEPEERGSALDEAEEAIEGEIEEPLSEREQFDELLEQEEPGETNELSELFERELGGDDPESSAVQEAEEEGIGLGVETEEDLTVGPNGESQDDMVKEREESERNCEEEIAKVRADRIDDIDLNIVLEGNAGEDFPFECHLDAGRHQPREWPQITYNWKAAALCHKPLYFEQVHLERYGHSWGPYVQPIMSGVHFFGTIPILPYKMGLKTPTECVYTLGYYRPGNCAPYLICPVPFTWRAALFQAGTATALPFIIP